MRKTARTESYVYCEDRVISGHKVGERVVHVLPKGTLHTERAPLRGLEGRQRAFWLAQVPQVIHSRGQAHTGYAVPPQNKAAQSGEAPRERGWNPLQPAPASVDRKSVV